MVLPLQTPLAYAVQTQVSACLLGGTAAQATALAKAPAFAGWTVVSESWRVDPKIPVGVPAPDPASVQAAWEANPDLSTRDAVPAAEAIGCLPPSDPPFPALPLAGLDPSAGLQLRFRVRRRAVPGFGGDPQGVVDSVYGMRRPPYARVGRWNAAVAALTDWGTPTYSATWPKAP